MKFFVPAAKNHWQSENLYRAAKKRVEDTTGQAVSDSRIFSITYCHEGKYYCCEVGRSDDRVGEVVVLVFESHTYLVCTIKRGVISGEPIQIAKDEVISRIDFD